MLVSELWLFSEMPFCPYSRHLLLYTEATVLSPCMFDTISAFSRLQALVYCSNIGFRHDIV